MGNQRLWKLVLNIRQGNFGRLPFAVVLYELIMTSVCIGGGTHRSEHGVNGAPVFLRLV